MPKRTNSQRIGSLGQREAAAAFEKLGDWIVRNQAEEDVGVDLEVELSNPDPTGHIVKCQIKSFHGKPHPKPVRLKDEFLRYVYECRIPIVLVLIETSSGDAWFCWLQGCIEIQRLQKLIYGKKSHTSIDSAWLQQLDQAGSEELTKIARGVHPIALVTYIRDLIRVALETRNHELAGMANALLFRYHKEIAYFPLDLVLDEVVALGLRIWATPEGNIIAELLYMLARGYGDMFTKNQLQRLVLRGETYSRTGINALSIMY